MPIHSENGLMSHYAAEEEANKITEKINAGAAESYDEAENMVVFETSLELLSESKKNLEHYIKQFR